MEPISNQAGALRKMQELCPVINKIIKLKNVNQDRISARIPNAAFLFEFLQFKDVVALCQLNRNWVRHNWAQTKQREYH